MTIFSSNPKQLEVVLSWKKSFISRRENFFDQWPQRNEVLLVLSRLKISRCYDEEAFQTVPGRHNVAYLWWPSKKIHTHFKLYMFFFFPFVIIVKICCEIIKVWEARLQTKTRQLLIYSCFHNWSWFGEHFEKDNISYWNKPEPHCAFEFNAKHRYAAWCYKLMTVGCLP